MSELRAADAAGRAEWLVALSLRAAGEERDGPGDPLRARQAASQRPGEAAGATDRTAAGRCPGAEDVAPAVEPRAAIAAVRRLTNGRHPLACCHDHGPRAHIGAAATRDL